MMNRFRRVAPLYWFFTILMAAILLLMPAVFKTTSFEWKSFLLSLGFVPHWSVAYPGFAWPIVAPGWSLIYEMYFYLLFAISLVFPQKVRLLFITTIIVLVFIAATATNTGESAIARFFSRDMVFEFVFGMLLAVAWKQGFRLPSAASWFLLLFGVSLLFIDIPFSRIFEYGIPSLLIVTACLFVRIKQYNWAVLLGDASYALYLSHIFTLGVMRKILQPILGEGPFAAYLFLSLIHI